MFEPSGVRVRGPWRQRRKRPPAGRDRDAPFGWGNGAGKIARKIGAVKIYEWNFKEGRERRKKLIPHIRSG